MRLEEAIGETSESDSETMLDSTIILSQSHNAWLNQAVEEYLFGIVREDQAFLMLYTNTDSVIIGRNQNPTYECSLSLLDKENVRLARRFTGGGAVYHDMGCLNYSFIMDKQHFNLSKHFSVILRELRDLGVPCEANGSHDLLAEGRKFSGNAFYYQKNTAIHHGTLLVSSDLTKLNRCLAVSDGDGIGPQGLPSRPAEVVNLSEYNDTISVKALMASLSAAFQTAFSGSTISLEEYNRLYGSEELLDIFAKLSSRQWIIHRQRTHLSHT